MDRVSAIFHRVSLSLPFTFLPLPLQRPAVLKIVVVVVGVLTLTPRRGGMPLAGNVLALHHHLCARFWQRILLTYGILISNALY